jgi:AraC-like DNA-binding protein
MVSLDDVVSYIERNLEGPIRVTTLARIVRLSPTHFRRVFTKSLGIPPGQYVSLRRLQAAMSLMRATTEPLCVIAVSSGYSDQSHLTRMFSRLVGVSPGRWRTAACQNPASVAQLLVPGASFNARRWRPGRRNSCSYGHEAQGRHAPQAPHPEAQLNAGLAALGSPVRVNSSAELERELYNDPA